MKLSSLFAHRRPIECESNTRRSHAYGDSPWRRTNCGQVHEIILNDSLRGAEMNSPSALESLFESLPAPELAQMLIGAIFLVDGVGGRIVETEAYDQEDPASHSFKGLTTRNASMFGRAARTYVYQSYGIHWCLNFVCGPVGHGAGVFDPRPGTDLRNSGNEVRRKTEHLRLLCSGPGRLCQALAITASHDAMPLDLPLFLLQMPDRPVSIVSGARVGITQARNVAWRFGLRNSPFLSCPIGDIVDATS